MSSVIETFIGNRPVRRAVVETALATEGPFSAEELFRVIQKRYGRIGRATIYRTLKLLCARKLFQEFVVRGGRRVYHPTSKEDTILWICDDCTTARTISAPAIKEALRLLAVPNGFEPLEFTVEVHSRCLRRQRGDHCDSPSQPPASPGKKRD